MTDDTRFASHRGLAPLRGSLHVGLTLACAWLAHAALVHAQPAPGAETAPAKPAPATPAKPEATSPKADAAPAAPATAPAETAPAAAPEGSAPTEAPQAEPEPEPAPVAEPEPAPVAEPAAPPAEAPAPLPPAMPDDSGMAQTQPPAPPVDWGAGVSFSFLRQHDFGEDTRSRFVPELFFLRYQKLSDRWFLRPGVRTGYQGLWQVEMPKRVRVEERALYGLGELGIVYDAMLVPSFSLGGGVMQRWIRLTVSGDVQSPTDDPLDRNETLGMIYWQFGLGIPISRGRFMVEPYLRNQYTFSDERSHWQYGFDASVGF